METPDVRVSAGEVDSPYDPRRFDQLSDAEVIRRIGALLAKALLRTRHLDSSRSSPGQPVDSPASPVNPLALIRDDTARQIVSFLQCAGPTSPHLIARTLGISRKIVARRLTRLRASGVCELAGRTRAVRYRVRSDFSGN